MELGEEEEEVKLYEKVEKRKEKKPEVGKKEEAKEDEKKGRIDGSRRETVWILI